MNTTRKREGEGRRLSGTIGMIPFKPEPHQVYLQMNVCVYSRAITHSTHFYSLPWPGFYLKSHTRENSDLLVKSQMQDQFGPESYKISSFLSFNICPPLQTESQKAHAGLELRM